MPKHEYWGQITFASSGLDTVIDALKGTPLKLIKSLPERVDIYGRKFTVLTVGCVSKQEYSNLEKFCKRLSA